MTERKIIDIDKVFDDVEIDEEQIRRDTAITKRELNGWHEANSKRLLDKEYLIKISNSLKNSDAVKERASRQSKDLGFAEKIRATALKNTASLDYVNPRGMLGKKRSEESKKKSSESLKGQTKPLDGNKKISEHRKGKKPKQESIEKMRIKLLGKETGRSRKVQTPAGVFGKLKDAADYYGISTGSIKNFIKGQNVKDWFKPQLESKGIEFDNLKPLGFSWLESAQKELGAKQIQTPDGIFDSATKAAEHYQITGTAIRHRIKSQPDKYYYITE